MVETGAQGALNGVSPGSRVSQDGCTPPLSSEGPPEVPWLSSQTSLLFSCGWKCPALLEALSPAGLLTSFPGCLTLESEGYSGRVRGEQRTNSFWALSSQPGAALIIPSHPTLKVGNRGPQAQKDPSEMTQPGLGQNLCMLPSHSLSSRRKTNDGEVWEHMQTAPCICASRPLSFL